MCSDIRSNCNLYLLACVVFQVTRSCFLSVKIPPLCNLLINKFFLDLILDIAEDDQLTQFEEPEVGNDISDTDQFANQLFPPDASELSGPALFLFCVLTLCVLAVARQLEKDTRRANTFEKENSLLGEARVALPVVHKPAPLHTQASQPCFIPSSLDEETYNLPKEKCKLTNCIIT